MSDAVLPIKLTRNQLAEFLPNERAIKAFEQIIYTTATGIPGDITTLTQLIEEASLEAGSGLAKAELALALLAQSETPAAAQVVQGFPGIPGEDGEDGSIIIIGSQGTGGTGAQGAPGVQGIPGPPGADAYDDATVVMVANPNLIGPITSVGNVTSVASQTGTGSTFVMQASPTLTTPNLGTPSALVGTNITGTAAGLSIGGNAATATTAGTVTTNANLTGPITSVGNATSIASQTGTGTTFVVATSPTLVTPVLGVATATSINKVGFTAPTTAATFAFGTDNATFTMQGTDTYVGRATTDTLTNKTLTSPVIATIVNSGTLTLPTSTDTLVGKATTDTFTNKTYDTAGSGNVLRINGTAISAVIGTGAVVLASSPTLTTPNIGAATATSPAYGSVGTQVPTAAFVRTAKGNFSGSIIASGSVTLTATEVGNSVLQTAASTTVTLPAPGAILVGDAITVVAVFSSGSITINVTGGSNIFNQYAVGATSFTMYAGESATFVNDNAGVYVVQAYTGSPSLLGTSGSIGGGLLAAGGVATGTATVTGAASGMAVVVTPNTYPGNGAVWSGYVSAANTVTVVVTGVIAVTPTASTYNVRVIP